MAAEYQRQRRIRMLSTETPEESAARRRADIERMKKNLERRKATETPEQAAERRAKVAKKVRMRRELVKTTMETPEQKAARLLKQNEQFRMRRQRKLSMETPEQAAERRSVETEKRRKRYKKKQETETPEQAAARHAKEAEKRKHRIEAKLANETPEKTTARLLMQNERRRKRRKEQLAMEAAIKQNSSVVGLVAGDVSGSCTWSSFEPSESSFSITTTEGSFNIRTTNELVQQSSDESMVIKNEISQDSWSFCEASSSRFVVQDIFQDNRDFESLKAKAQYDYCNQSVENEPLKEFSQTLFNVKVERDEHIIYGEYIADRLRKCNRNNAEINVAKNHIESIMFNLSAGSYNYTSSTEIATAQQIEAWSWLTQAVIVKEEVDL